MNSFMNNPPSFSARPPEMKVKYMHIIKSGLEGNKTFHSPKKKSQIIQVKLSDRFIPCSISEKLKCELIPLSPSPNSSKIPSKNEFQTERKSIQTYQKILFNELLEKESPSKRKINFSLSKTKRRQSSPSPSLLLSDEINKRKSPMYFPGTPSKKPKITLPYKTINFLNAIDNFYYNILDMYDLSKIAIGTKMGISLYNANFISKRKIVDINSQNEPLCVHFLSNTSLIHSHTSCDILLTDLKAMKTYSILANQKAVLTMDSNNENIVFYGTDTGSVESIDLRVNYLNFHNINRFYSHDDSNEVCKIRHDTNNSILISGGNDNKGIVYDLRKGKIAFTLRHNAAIKGVSINNEGTQFATGGGTYDKMIKLWDIKKYSLISQTSTESQVTNLEFIKGGKIFASFGYIGNNMVLHNLNYNLIEQNTINKINLLTDEEDKDEIIDIFEESVFFEKHSKRILFTSKDKNEEYIATASNDGVIKIWNIDKYHKGGNNKLDCNNILTKIR